MATIQIFAGKGGVGKTTSATSLAAFYAASQLKTALIDFDGGHSVCRTLGIAPIEANRLISHSEDLYLATVETVSFRSFESVKYTGGTIEDYLNQFPGDMGLVPLNDMCHVFFGLCTDLDTIQKVVVLLQLLEEAKKQSVEKVIIDVEPTAGLQRLLAGTSAIARSIRNLSETGTVKLLAIGAAWPDIKAYLEGDYIQHARIYADRLEAVSNDLRQACYHLVSIGEVSPSEQTFDVRRIIESFGGTISSCILNNLRGERNERDARVILQEHQLPIVAINRNKRLQQKGSNLAELIAIGEQIA